MAKGNYSEKLRHPNWQKKRLKILERDQFTCQVCGDNERTLHVHHIAYFGDPWETPDRLLVTLCEVCHNEEESAMKNMQYEIIKGLRQAGFMATESLPFIPKIFADTNRGWTFYDPALSILKMIIDDNELWSSMESLYFERLSNKNK